MTRDHFIPVIYLKRFCDPTNPGRLHVYRKRTLKHALQAPHKICVEGGGDINRYFPTNPRIIREYLDLIEPNLGKNIDQLIEDPTDPDARFAVAGIMSYILCWTPTARRIGTKALEGNLEAARPAFAKHARHNIDDPEEARLTAEALLDRNIKFEVDPNYPRARMLQGMVGIQARLYKGDWAVLKNETDQPFITSDFPACKLSIGDADTGVNHYFPLSPEWAVVVFVGPGETEMIPDVKQMRTGSTSAGAIRPEAVPDLNQLVARCAEDVLISNTDGPWLKKLVSDSQDWGMDARVDSIPAPDGIYQISRVFHRRKTDAPAP